MTTANNKLGNTVKTNQDESKKKKERENPHPLTVSESLEYKILNIARKRVPQRNENSIKTSKSRNGT